MQYKQFHGQFQPPVDFHIRSYFPDYAYQGTFIDVGAANPIHDNNSYHFEKNGWNVYTFEPNPEYYMCQKVMRAHAFPFAISNENKSDVEFTVFDLFGHNMGACSGLKPDLALVEQHRPLIQNTFIIKTVCRTLDSLLSDELSSVKQIDVLSIDTEGTELDVLNGLDLNKWKPKLIVSENNYNTSEVRDYLAQFGYRLHQRIEVNDFFVL